MEYLTAAEIAKRWNVSQRRIQILCATGRIPGVFKLGDIWAIPENAIKPCDIRKNNGRKIKDSECY